MDRGARWVTVHGVAKNQNNTRGESPRPFVSQGRRDGPQAADRKPLGRTEPWHLSCPTTTLKDAVWYLDPCSSELLSVLISELGCKRKRKKGRRQEEREEKKDGRNKREDVKTEKKRKAGREEDRKY